MMPMSPPEPKRGVSLAKLASFFAAMFIVSLGICGYSAHTGQEFGGTPGFLSLIGMIVSTVCLLAIGLAALIGTYK
jgi:hypothetical protein